jgi:hypothetical protein
VHQQLLQVDVKLVVVVVVVLLLLLCAPVKQPMIRSYIALVRSCRPIF